MPIYETPEEAARRKHRAMAARAIARFDKAYNALPVADKVLKYRRYNQPRIEEDEFVKVRTILRRAGITGIRRPR